MILEYVFVVSRQFSILIFSISVAKFLLFPNYISFYLRFKLFNLLAMNVSTYSTRYIIVLEDLNRCSWITDER